MDDFGIKLQEILRDVLEDDSIEISDTMSAADFPGWDSLAHLNIVIAMEKKCGVRFAAAEIAALKKPGQTIGTFLEAVRRKASAQRA